MKESTDARLARIKERFDTGFISMTDLLWMIDKIHAGTPKGMVRITSRPRRKMLDLDKPISNVTPLKTPLLGTVHKTTVIAGYETVEREKQRKRWREAAARRKEKVKRSTKS